LCSSLIHNRFHLMRFYVCLISHTMVIYLYTGNSHTPLPLPMFIFMSHDAIWCGIKTKQQKYCANNKLTNKYEKLPGKTIYFPVLFSFFSMSRHKAKSLLRTKYGRKTFWLTKLYTHYITLPWHFILAIGHWAATIWIWLH